MSKHQYAVVMDLNKCIGCQTCTIACKKQWTDEDGMGYMYWNNVETQPGAGYPRGWHTEGGGFDSRRNLVPSSIPTEDDYGKPFEYDYSKRMFKGSAKPIMPDHPPVNGPNWDEDVGGFDTDNPYYFYLPRICNHCTHPACLAACPRGAIYKREEDGIVLVDQERCRNYRHCLSACPYKKIYFNAVTETSQKCIFCYPRLEQGTPQACMAQCPGRIRFVGLLDDPESPVHKIVMVHKAALPLFPERGTHPNVFYIPPFSPPKGGKPGAGVLDDPRVPMASLEYLFGPEVREVMSRLGSQLAAAQSGKPSELLQLLIGRTAADRFHIVPQKLKTATPPDVASTLPQEAAGPGLTLRGSPPHGENEEGK
jgi:DMSO reductase family type II enzyme iron-sulfur subunit